MDIAGAMPDIEHLSCLCQCAEQRIVASLPLLFTVEALPRFPWRNFRWTKPILEASVTQQQMDDQQQNGQSMTQDRTGLQTQTLLRLKKHQSRREVSFRYKHISRARYTRILPEISEFIYPSNN